MADFFKTEEKSVSRFNEASLKLNRLNQEQMKINFANINLLGFNEEAGIYNYQIKFNSLNSLFEEVSAELTTKGDNELKEGLDMIEKIEKQLEKKQVFTKRENMLTHKTELELNKENWRELKKLLLEYTLMIKRFMKNHGMALPESDDPSLAGWR